MARGRFAYESASFALVESFNISPEAPAGVVERPRPGLPRSLGVEASRHAGDFHNANDRHHHDGYRL